MATNNGDIQAEYDSKSPLFTSSNSAQHNNSAVGSIHITVQVHVQPERQENYQIKCNSTVKSEDKRRPSGHENEFENMKDIPPYTSNHVGKNCPFGFKDKPIAGTGSRSCQPLTACSHLSSTERSYSNADDSKQNNANSGSLKTTDNSGKQINSVSPFTNIACKALKTEANADEIYTSFPSNITGNFYPNVLRKDNKMDSCDGKRESTNKVIANSSNKIRVSQDTIQLPQGRKFSSFDKQARNSQHLS